MNDNEKAGVVGGLVIVAIVSVIAGLLWGGYKILDTAETAAQEQVCKGRCPEGFETRAKLEQGKFHCYCSRMMEAE